MDMGMLSSVDVVEWQSLPHLTQEAWADHTVVNFGVNENKNDCFNCTINRGAIILQALDVLSTSKPHDDA